MTNGNRKSAPQADLRIKVEALRETILLNCTAYSRHPLIQSCFISLWANVDIYYAMNYMISAFCTAFDEVAVVTLLKQLTQHSVRNSEESFVRIIKAVWDAIFPRDKLKDAVLRDASRNVASYSLLSLANNHMNYDDGILETLVKLFEESTKANQKITSATHNCVVHRLEKISPQIFKKKHKRMIARVWKQVRPRLQHKQDAFRDEWLDLMFHVCRKFELTILKGKIHRVGR